MSRILLEDPKLLTRECELYQSQSFPRSACCTFTNKPAVAQVECPAVTPEVVLKASGHVERFTDFMVTDAKTGDCHRADHLLKGHLEALLEDKKAPLSAEKQQVSYTHSIYHAIMHT